MSNTNNTIEDVITSISVRDICDTLRVGDTAVSNAKARGKFPSSWYLPLKSLGECRGIDVPLELFNWRIAGESA